MPRPRLHRDDVVLDAARGLLVRDGASAVTTAAISRGSGAPTGSLYHRFGSRQELVAELWVRTVRRFQHGLLDACSGAEPGLDRALAGAGWVVVFASEQREDAQLLLQCRREELLGPAARSPRLAAELASLNEPVVALVRRLAEELFGAADPTAIETVTLAVVDLPQAAVARHLRTGSDPARHAEQIRFGVRALLSAAGAPSPVREESA